MPDVEARKFPTPLAMFGGSECNFCRPWLINSLRTRLDRAILRVGDPENFTPHDYATATNRVNAKNALLDNDSQEAGLYGGTEDFCSFASWRARLGYPSLVAKIEILRPVLSERDCILLTPACVCTLLRTLFQIVCKHHIFRCWSLASLICLSCCRSSNAVGLAESMLHDLGSLNCVSNISAANGVPVKAAISL